MDFDANDYYRAALERMRQARLLYQSGDSFAMAMYVAVHSGHDALRWISTDRDAVVALDVRFGSFQ